MRIGRVTISDRASAGVYADRSGPEADQILREFFGHSVSLETRVVPDNREDITACLMELADKRGCDLIVTTGGTGIAPRDVTPEATRSVLEKELPGFGEVMRAASMARVRTAILSRATAGVRGRCLIINLPGKPSAVRECLGVLREAIVEALPLIRGEDPHAGSQGAGECAM